MDDGHIKLYRRILNSAVWTTSPQVVKTFLTCLLLANWEARKFYSKRIGKEIMVTRGSFITSWAALAKASHLSVQSSRTGIQVLTNLEILTRESTSNLTKITILNYEQYQSMPTKKLTKSLTADQQVTNKDIRSKEVKEVKENTLRDASGNAAAAKCKPPRTPLQKLLSVVKVLQGYALDDATWNPLFKRYAKAGKDLLEFFGGDWELAARCLEDGVKERTSQNRQWSVDGILTYYAPEWKAKHG